MVLATATSCAAAQTATAPRPTLADIFRRYADRYRRTCGRRLTPQEDRALREIEACGTSVLGGHVEQCSTCGHAEYHWNSCRNRHCPRCGGYRRHRWYEDRLEEILPVDYAHLVFTLPETLSELTHANGPLIYHLLFTAAAQALLCVACTWTPLGVDTGFIAVLHSWGQLLLSSRPPARLVARGRTVLGWHRLAVARAGRRAAHAPAAGGVSHAAARWPPTSV